MISAEEYERQFYLTIEPIFESIEEGVISDINKKIQSKTKDDLFIKLFYRDTLDRKQYQYLSQFIKRLSKKLLKKHNYKLYEISNELLTVYILYEKDTKLDIELYNTKFNELLLSDLEKNIIQKLDDIWISNDYKNYKVDLINDYSDEFFTIYRKDFEKEELYEMLCEHAQKFIEDYLSKQGYCTTWKSDKHGMSFRFYIERDDKN